ncbi:MAG: tRNA (N6-isopentenyl adenosine(37)-C2)-methylthiotransferase MiaB [Eubacteriales bacterium]|nr:tRNA (N6-isopentenyl adenosine(37)-C2)-methylthiotransferase MiaB [Eubacteriales bacterium]
MGREREEISPQAVAEQLALCERLRARLTAEGRQPLALVDTYGCQQNEADSEHLRGFLKQMGFAFTQDEFEADVIVVNTCAVREHAEQRVLGNVGALTHTKAKKPGQIVAVCGCMVQQPHMADKIRKSYRMVDLVFGPHELWRFPELLERAMEGRGRVFAADPFDGAVAEGLPVSRDGGVRAWLSVMYGCNNFCSYCVVPYVRGRERSRRPEDVLAEARRLLADGAKDITLLGQNVNSYGRDLGLNMDFSGLLRELNALPGDFRLRFMTSHPKDATERLFETMASCEKCAHHLHLPVQAGSDRVLRAMNRGYDAAGYLEKVELLRKYIPDIVLTTDIIVGFPGETEEEFEDTLRLVEKVRYDAMFTFIYSKREGTPAAKMPDPVSREEKQRRFDRLLETSNRISAEKHAAYVGQTLRVLVDGPGSGDYPLAARTDGGRLVHLRGSEENIGRFVKARITSGNTWALFGEVTDG